MNNAAKSSPRASLNRRALLAALGLTAILPLRAADTSAAAPDAQTDEVVKMDAFTVKGYRQSLEASIETKREASAIVDVITAQDVGKFPDTNVAESLSHIPGVTVDRLFGQGERVSILGTDPNLNRTLLNGQTVASGDWFILDAPSRQFNYTLLAPEVIGKAEVYRTPEARLPEGSIGGTILLHTQNPLDLRPIVFTGTVENMYNDRSKKNDPSFSGVFSWRSADRKFGLLVGLQNNKEQIRRDGVEALGTITAGAASPNTGIDPAAPAGSLNLTNPTAYMPNAINSAYFLQTRHRVGGNAVIAWRPTKEISFELNVLNVKVDNNNFNSSYYVFPGWWRGAVVSSGKVVDGIVDSATIKQNIGVMDIFYRESSIKTEAYDLKGSYVGHSFTLSAQAGYTKATGGTQHQYYMEPLLGTAASGVGSTSYSYTGGVSNPSFTWSESGVASNAAAWTVGGPWWNGNVASDPEKDDEKYAQADVDFPIRDNFITKIRTGARYSKHSTEQNWYNLSLTTLPFYTLADFGPSLTPDNYLKGLPNITSDMAKHVIIDPVKLGNAVEKAPSAAGSSLTMKQAVDGGAGFQAAQSFKVDETISSGYVQADFAADKLSGNIGMRAVQTKTDSTGFAISGSTVTKIVMSNAYTNVLPSLNVAYKLQPDLILRGGASSVIARPNYADLSSSVTLYDSIRQGAGGNPGLKPYKADALDAALEWYYSKDTSLGVNLFYKDISNYILKSNGTENYFNENQGVVTPYTISRPMNAGSASSKGFMLFIQHALPYGFGINANYAYVDATSSTGQDLPFSSKNQLNFSPYWEYKNFLVRLTYAYRGDYFTNVDRGNNVYTRAYRELDLNAAYNFTKNFSVTFAATNLLDETYYVYTKVPAKMFQAEYKNGIRMQTGIHWSF